MSYSGLSAKQKTQTEEWIFSAFERYLARDIHKTTELLPPEAVDRFMEDRRSYIQRYGDEFRRVLHGEVQICYGVDRIKLREDLHKLMTRECTALDIVDLMLHCHPGVGHDACWTENLRYEEAYNYRLKQDLEQLAVQVSDLLNPEGGMPHHLRKLMPEKYKEQGPRMWQLVCSLPETLDCMAAMIESYSPTKAAAKRSYGARIFLAYFYVFLKHFNCGFPTLSRLLRVMRQVSRTIASRPDCPICHFPIGRSCSAKLSEEKSKGTPDDPLSQTALQRSTCRFFQENPGWKSSMSDDVTKYMSVEYAEHRARGETFSDALEHIDEQGPSRLASEPADSAAQCDLDVSAADTGGE
jgi:hypothetical protein